MKSLLYKEFHLTASPVSFVFLLGAAAAFVPALPPTLGPLLVCLGIFYSFWNLREANDLLFSMLLPQSRRQIVEGKFGFVLILELAGFVICAVAAAVRCFFLGETASRLLPANAVFLGFGLLIFGLFNLIFLGGFFRFAGAGTFRSFWRFLLPAVLLMLLCEALHRIPGLAVLGGVGAAGRIPRLIILVVCAAGAFGLNLLAFRKSVQAFQELEN